MGHLEAALEASCATLMALESARLDNGQTTADTSAVQGQISSAIVSVRKAMSELRALHQVDTSVLAFGFVLPDPEWPPTESRRRQSGQSQASPRRTA
jgi:hypothetical protein